MECKQKKRKCGKALRFLAGLGPLSLALSAVATHRTDTLSHPQQQQLSAALSRMQLFLRPARKLSLSLASKFTDYCIQFAKITVKVQDIFKSNPIK